jgi:hypothetical protein
VAEQSEGFNTVLTNTQAVDWSFLSSIPQKVMQDSTAAIQSEDST